MSECRKKGKGKKVGKRGKGEGGNRTVDGTLRLIPLFPLLFLFPFLDLG
jgi:hypothetical protein